MASLVQCRKIQELVLLDYQSIEHPEYKDLDPMDMPIGGPVIMKSPEGGYVRVMSDGSVEPYVMGDK